MSNVLKHPGPKPELKWIKLSQLFVPSEYQRSIKTDASAKNLNYIKAYFNWGDCGALIVTPLSDASPAQYAVIDGQHRLRAAEARGDIEELPCVVIAAREAREQAKNFVVINKRRVKLNPLQEYHAEVVAGVPDAVSLHDILQKCDITIAAYPMSHQDMHPRVTMAVGTLLKMIPNYSEKQITWVLTIIPEAYGDAKGMLRASLIRVLAQFIKANPDADRARMIAALQDIDVDELQEAARTFRQIQGGTTASAMLAVVERAYKHAGRGR